MPYSWSGISETTNRLEPNSEPKVELFQLTSRSVGEEINVCCGTPLRFWSHFYATLSHQWSTNTAITDLLIT